MKPFPKSVPFEITMESVPYSVIERAKLSKTYVTDQLCGYIIKTIDENKAYLKCKFYGAK